MRIAITDLEDKAEARIEDFWTQDSNRQLFADWTGKTIFELLRPEPPQGYEYTNGRLTKQQTTTRPGNVWLEVWPSMSPKAII